LSPSCMPLFLLCKKQHAAFLSFFPIKAITM
jgi:hypothetical protein